MSSAGFLGPGQVGTFPAQGPWWPCYKHKCQVPFISGLGMLYQSFASPNCRLNDIGLTLGQSRQVQLAQRPLAWCRQNVRHQSGWADAASEGMACPCPSKRPTPWLHSMRRTPEGKSGWSCQYEQQWPGREIFCLEDKQGRSGWTLGLMHLPEEALWLLCLRRGEWPEA